MLYKEESPSRVFLRLQIEGISACMTSQDVDVFVRFRDRYDVGQFPNMRYLVVVDCSVVYVREVL